MRNKRLIGRIFAALLCVCMALGAFCTSASAASVSFDGMVSAASDIIRANEGAYASVNPDDNGALSVGWLQWHANRALSLVKSIVAGDTANAKKLLGTALYNEITSASSTAWSSRVLTSDEKTRLSALMDSSVGHTEQDKLAYSDISVYINHGMTLGIKDPSALVFFADIENQCGGGGSARVASSAISAAGSADKVTLKVLHDAAMADKVAGKYETRRNKTYNACLILGWDSLAENFEVWVATSSVNVRKGPDTAYERLTSIAAGGQIAVTAKKSIDGYCWGKTPIGWLCLDYCEWNSGSLGAQVLFDANGGDVPSPVIAWRDVRYNTSRCADSLAVFDAKLGSSAAPTNPYGAETTVAADGKVTAAPSYGVSHSPIPAKGFVISGHGEGMHWLYQYVGEDSYIYFDSELCRVYVLSDAQSYAAQGYNSVFGKAYGSLPTATRAGYSFDGWYTKANGGERVGASTVCATHSSQALYAHWRLGELSSAAFDTDGGYFEGTVATALSGLNCGRGENMMIVYDGSAGYDKTNTNVHGAEISVDSSGRVVEAPGWGSCKLSIPSGGFAVSGHGNAGWWLCVNVSVGDYVSYSADAGTVTVYKSKDTYEALNRQVRVGSPVGKLPTPVKEYYDFKGWYTESGKLATEKTVLDKAGMVLRARWEIAPTTLKFDPAGGTVTGQTATRTLSGKNRSRGTDMLIMYDSGKRSGTNSYGYEAIVAADGTVIKSFPYGTGDSPIPAGGFVLSGHSSGGWWLYTNVHDGDYVKVTGNTVTVYPCVGSSMGDSRTVKYGSAYGELPAASRDGYTFLGWADVNGKTVKASDTIDIYGDITLTALWQKTDTVKFDTVGGKISVPCAYTAVNSINTGRGTNKLVVITGTAKTGTNEYGREACVASDGKVISVNYGGNSDVPKFGFVISGHGTMSDWILANVHVGQYVYWSGTTVYVYNSRSEYDMQSGSFEIADGESFASLALSLPQAVKADAAFAGWTLDGSAFTADTAVCGDITLKAKWKASKAAAIFDPCGGTVDGAVSSAVLSGTNRSRGTNMLVLYKDKETTGTNPYGTEALIDSNGRVASVTFYWGDIKIPNGCTVLSGHGTMSDWIRDNIEVGMYVNVSQNKVSVYKNRAAYLAANGGVVLEVGNAYGTLPEASRSGYAFGGWKNSAGQIVSSDMTVADCDDPTLTAVWLDEITISLDTDGGKIGAVSSMSLYNMNTGRPADKLIMYAGKASTGTNEYGAEAIVSYDGRVVEFYSYYGDHRMPDGCFALSGHGTAAKWLTDNCRVGSYVKVDILGKVTAYASKADFDAASGTLKVAAGSTASCLPVPVKSGEVFDGWYTVDGVKLEPDSVLSASETLYARFYK